MGGVSTVRLAGALAALMLAVSACSSPDGIGASPVSSGGGTFRERMASLFGSDSTAAAATTAPSFNDYDCPPINIRSGASTLMAHVPNQEPSATNLRYQVSIGQTARECAALGATMTIKVGMQGRVIIGPAGATGQIEVPIRMALVREGPEPKTIWTKLYRIPVGIPPNQPNVSFLHIEEDLTFPLPSAGELDAYVVYLGFDPDGVREQRRPQKQQKQPRQPKQAQAG